MITVRRTAWHIRTGTRFDRGNLHGEYVAVCSPVPTLASDDFITTMVKESVAARHSAYMDTHERTPAPDMVVYYLHDGYRVLAYIKAGGECWFEGLVWNTNLQQQTKTYLGRQLEARAWQVSQPNHRWH